MYDKFIANFILIFVLLFSVSFASSAMAHKGKHKPLVCIPEEERTERQLGTDKFNNFWLLICFIHDIST